MKKFIKWLTAIITTLFSLLFIASALMAFVLFNIGKRMFESEVYKSAMADLNLYERFPGFIGILLMNSENATPCLENPVTCVEISEELQACYIDKLTIDRYSILASKRDMPSPLESQSIQSCLEQFGAIASTDNPEEGGMPPFFKNLTATEWESLIRIIVPPDQLKTMTENFLDSLFACFKGRTAEVSISLVPIKDRLNGPAGNDLVLQLIYSQPPCTDEELASLRNPSSDAMIICYPPDDVMEEVVPVLVKQLRNEISQLPDQTTIITSLSQNTSSAKGSLNPNFFQAYRMIRTALLLTPLLPMLFLFLITISNVRSLHSWLLSWGIPFIITGFSALFAGSGISNFINRAWEAYIEPTFPSHFRTVLSGLSQNIIQYLGHDLAECVVLQAIILVIIGLSACATTIYRIKKQGNLPSSSLPHLGIEG